MLISFSFQARGCDLRHPLQLSGHTHSLRRCQRFAGWRASGMTAAASTLLKSEQCPPSGVFLWTQTKSESSSRVLRSRDSWRHHQIKAPRQRKPLPSKERTKRIQMVEHHQNPIMRFWPRYLRKLQIKTDKRRQKRNTRTQQSSYLPHRQ